MRGAKVCQQALAKAMAATLRKMKETKQRIKTASEQPKEVKGKQSIRQLSKGGTLSNIEITDGNIKSFEPIARKYGIGYSLQKDDAADPPRWVVLFKAKDVDAVTAAFKEYSRKTLSKDLQKKSKERVSVRDTMKKHRETSRDAVRERVKGKTREAER